jgi:hypothetical protein
VGEQECGEATAQASGSMEKLLLVQEAGVVEEADLLVQEGD